MAALIERVGLLAERIAPVVGEHSARNLASNVLFGLPRIAIDDRLRAVRTIVENDPSFLDLDLATQAQVRVLIREFLATDGILTDDQQETR